MAKVTMLNMQGANAGTIELNDEIFAITPNEFAVRHRQGHSTDPSQIGGGIVFAPKPRDYRYTLPKKLRRLAMKSALSSKVAENQIVVVDELKFEEPKTKEMLKFLQAVNADKKALIITAEKDENVVKSAANIPGVRTALATTMNVYEIVNHTSFIVTKEAVELIEEVYK